MSVSRQITIDGLARVLCMSEFLDKEPVKAPSSTTTTTADRFAYGSTSADSDGVGYRVGGGGGGRRGSPADFGTSGRNYYQRASTVNTEPRLLVNNVHVFGGGRSSTRAMVDLDYDDTGFGAGTMTTTTTTTVAGDLHGGGAWRLHRSGGGYGTGGYRTLVKSSRRGGDDETRGWGPYCSDGQLLHHHRQQQTTFAADNGNCSGVGGSNGGFRSAAAATVASGTAFQPYRRSNNDATSSSAVPSAARAPAAATTTTTGCAVSPPLEQDIREIRRILKSYMSRLGDKDANAKTAKEWRIVARVLDRLFFFMYCSTIVVSLATIFPKG